MLWESQKKRAGAGILMSDKTAFKSKCYKKQRRILYINKRLDKKHFRAHFSLDLSSILFLLLPSPLVIHIGKLGDRIQR